VTAIKLASVFLLSIIFCVAAQAQEPTASAELSSNALRQLCIHSSKQKLFPRTDGVRPIDELKGGQAICKMARGRTMPEILLAIGSPHLDNLVLDASPAANGSRKNWLYIVGKFPVLVHLAFENGICYMTSFALYYDDPWYADWRRREIAKFAINKSVAEILKGEGSTVSIRRYQPETNCKLSFLIQSEYLDVWVNKDKCFSVEDSHMVLTGGNSTYTCDGCEQTDTMLWLQRFRRSKPDLDFSTLKADGRFQMEAIFKTP